MDGFDTGFFFDLWQGRDRARARWQTITEGDQPAAVSSVTLFELSRHGLVGRLDRDFADAVVQQAGTAFEQARVDPVAVLRRAARITHGAGLPMADALIAASLEHVGCEALYTGDSDFESYEGDLEIVLL